jgi:hypothetical protein
MSANVAAELVALLERYADAAGPLPRVRALHVPPASADGRKDGEFCALELDDGSLGFSYLLLGDTLARLRDAADARSSFAGLDALVLARDYASEHGVRRTLGFAAVNALSRSLFDRAD